MNQRPRHDVVVIGAGIIGLSIALALRRDGRDVLIVDRKGVCAGASRGNAGAFAFADIQPLASPGILRQAPRWLFDPLGPLSVRPAHAFRLLPWLLQFWRASLARSFAQGTVAQAALMKLSQSELPGFAAAAGAGHLIRQCAAIELHRTSRDARSSENRLRAANGVPFQFLGSASEIAERQPGLSPQFNAATVLPDWYMTTDPADYALAIADAFRASGGQIELGEIVLIRPQGSGVILDRNGAKPLPANCAVIAAGAHSGRLSRMLGDKLPLESERGYNTTLPPAAFDLRHQLVFPDSGFVVSPLSSGVRVGGAVEFAGLEAAADFRRSRAMLEKAKGFMPGLRTEGGREWMGHRPSLPDSLPAIGHARATRAVIHAFGHGHLGLTQSAGTARLVADLVAGRTPPLDMTPFLPHRFSFIRR